jgi:uncharacterized protein YbjT (DUF2867 family)
MKKRTALVFGASGLVGGELLNLLLANANYDAIISFGRKELDIKHPKLEQIVIDFNKLNSYKELMNANDLFCCLGTTIKKAKSKEAFRKIDFEYVSQIGNIAAENKVKNFSVVSSIGTDKNSGNFYLKTKGEMEDALKKLNFEQLLIFRPSVLLGKRNEQRVGEQIGKVAVQILSPLLIGKLKKYRGVKASVVAQKMINLNLLDRKGVFIIESDFINN